MRECNKKLSVSIVIYYPDMSQLYLTISSLKDSFVYAKKNNMISYLDIYIINNGAYNDSFNELKAYMKKGFSQSEIKYCFVSGHGNIGYGKANNKCIAQLDSDYHLILNPDVFIFPRALKKGFLFFSQSPDVGLTAPVVLNEKGQKSHLCKRYPDIITLFLRGTGLKKVQKIFKNRLDKYSFKDLDLTCVHKDLPIISGSFMLFKTAVLKKVSGFDPAYFLYFEDFDLSIRTGELTRKALLPQMEIMHYGGKAARKGYKHILYFCVSALKFFQRNGWKWS